MKILGISGLYHDSAVAIVENGRLIAASHEERYSKNKQDSSFPVLAAGRVLSNSNNSIREIDLVAWYEKPELKFGRSQKIVHDKWPSRSGFNSFKQLLTTPYFERDFIKKILFEELNYSGKIEFVTHHESHMASALFGKKGSGRTLTLTIDGIGEYESGTAFIFDFDNPSIHPKKIWSLEYPNSIGLFYSAVTQFLGFEVNEGEYKVMGLAAYGKPIYLQNLIENALSLRSTTLNPIFKDNLINWGDSKLAYGQNLPKLFDLNELPTNFEDKANIASSAQKFIEFLIIGILRELVSTHKPKSLRMAGGVALNCSANSEIVREFGIPLDVYPAAGDAGAAAGAALYSAFLKNDWQNFNAPEQYSIYLGSNVGEPLELENYSEKYSREFRMEEVKVDSIAKILADGLVVGLAKGRAEYGPRALGNRCILASPLNPGMKDHLNKAIKFREQFRPFAPVVCSDDYETYFERLKGDSARHMLFTVKSKQPTLIPAVTHIDGTSRVQELFPSENDFLYKLIKKFGELTGVPVLILTSFNLKGQPIVQDANDAYMTFINSGIDALILESKIFYKKI